MMPDTLTPARFRLILIAVTAPNMIRIIGGGQRTLATMNGDLAAFHYLPGIGDVLAGVGAVILTGLLLSNNQLLPRVRDFAWKWNVFGAVDLLIAIPVNIAFPPADPRFFTPVLATSFLVCHLAMLSVLWKSRRADWRQR